jgi:hypothetical protein
MRRLIYILMGYTYYKEDTPMKFIFTTSSTRLSFISGSAYFSVQPFQDEFCLITSWNAKQPGMLLTKGTEADMLDAHKRLIGEIKHQMILGNPYYELEEWQEKTICKGERE